MTPTAGTDVPTVHSNNTEPSNRGLSGKIDGFLKSPFAGIAPWALMSILSGPGRFEVAVGAALGLSLLVMAASRLRGLKIHVLDIFGAAVFAALALVGLFAGNATIEWLATWSGELVNVSLAVFAWITLLIGKPFTMAYAKETAPREYWDSPLFRRINNVVTGVWASAFAFAAAIGLIGDLFFHGGNIWTAWIFQLAAIFFAVSFSEFYPDYASAKFDLALGQQAQVPSLVQIFAWAPTFATVAGIIGLVTGDLDFVMGLALIIGGSVASGMVAKATPGETKQ